jgi:lipopolysaccharide transport system ATP-binding protein
LKPILEIKGLSKKYRIQAQAEPYLSLRDSLFRFARPAKKETFWALSDVSFEVQPGDTVGIIGRNGAGKSTLLKILSKITPPTKGSVICRGHIASLLEVGTGFHPELTGRENIFLNGSILGIKRQEVKRRFDAIVDFAGVQRFVETPLKHYSSGMQLRLAFAVAAFLDPEILVIDEVLAVGDAEFQKKCLRKMEEVSRNGRTILFVSHDMPAVENLCKSAILLEDGMVKGSGATSGVIRSYIGKIRQQNNIAFDLQKWARTGSGKITFQSVEMPGDSGRIIPGAPLSIRIGLKNNSANAGLAVYVAATVFDNQRSKLFTLDNLYTAQTITASGSAFSVVCHVPSLPLMPGQYSVDLWCADHFETFDEIHKAAVFTVEEADIYNTGKIHNVSSHGYFIVPNHWKNI